MGLRCVAHLGTGHHRWQRGLRSSASYSVLGLSAAVLLTAGAWADIDAGTTVKASTLSGSNSTMNGGTLQLDESKTYSRDFNFKDVTGSTIDILGSTSTISGKLSGTGGITFSDTTGGGTLTLTNSNNNYTGFTTISSGATLALYDSDTGSDTNTTSGSIQHSAQLVDNGTFDISGTAAGTTIIGLSGSGKVVLGSKTLTIYNYDSNYDTNNNDKTYSDATTFSGVISGTGSLQITQVSTLTLTGVNTYTGSTSLSSGTLTLSGDGSISSSSVVYIYGTLNVAGANSAVLKSLGGSGDVVLGDNDLTLTSAGNTFSGVISGNGAVVLESGTQYLTGDNTMAGGIVIKGGTMELGSTTVTYDVANSGTLAFYSSTTIDMSGVISGTGDVKSIGSATTTISAEQTYTGATTITSGTIKLSGSGSIASSSGVAVNGTFDIRDTSGTSIQGLSGSSTGTVYLGSEYLTITGAGGTFAGAISGTGGLVLTGSTQTLSGTNTYTGSTTISSGTLVLVAGSTLRSTVIDNSVLDVSTTGTSNKTSATIASLSGSGSVVLGSNTLVISNAADTFSGVISGTGGISISSGTETLTGANTYTGTTTVTGGTLALSATGSISSSSALAITGTFDASAASGSQLTYASLSGGGTVVMGAHDLNLSTAAGTFSGVIQGSGRVTISSGSEIFSGNNTYTGGTTIASGASLQLGSGSSAGSVQGDIVDNGTLTFDRNDSSVYSGVISGSGALIQKGTGTTILTGANTYTGATTISLGTLQIGDGGTTGSITGPIVDNGTLAFSRSDGVTYSGVISGTGGVSALTGTTVLTSVESYTGATKISSGATLTLTGSGSIASSSYVQADGTFNVSAVSAPTITSLSGTGAVTLGSQTLTISDASTSFSGVISGTGGITLTSGDQTLSGTNTYTGQTTINGGTLTVTGSISSSSGVVINSGGTLAGTGTTSGLTVASGGTVSAGTSGSTGTLTVNGDVSFASGSIYNVAVNSTSASKLVVSGKATLAGSLTVSSTDGTYLVGQKTTVLTASSLTGDFSYTTTTFQGSNGAYFTSNISKDASNVYLEVDLAKLSNLLGTGTSKNQLAVAGGIDAAIASGSTVSAKIQNLGNDTAERLLTDTNQLSGELGADLSLAARSLFAPFVESMSSHSSKSALQAASGHVDSWVSGVIGSSIVQGNATDGSHKFRSDVDGIAMGASWTPWRNVLLGVALSAETSQFHIADGLGKGHSNALQGGVYGYMQASPHFYQSFAAGISFAQIKTERVVTVSGTDDLTGKLNVFSFGGRYEAGISLGAVSPYIAAEDQLSLLPSYSETARSGSSDFALHYASQTANTANVEVGIRHQIDLDVTPRWILTPDWIMRVTDRIAWVHDFSNSASADANFVDLSSSSFAVKGAKTGRDAVRASLGADFVFANGFSITSHIDSTFSKKSQAFAGFAGVGYTW